MWVSIPLQNTQTFSPYSRKTPGTCVPSSVPSTWAEEIVCYWPQISSSRHIPSRKMDEPLAIMLYMQLKWVFPIWGAVGTLWGLPDDGVQLSRLCYTKPAEILSKNLPIVPSLKVIFCIPQNMPAVPVRHRRCCTIQEFYFKVKLHTVPFFKNSEQVFWMHWDNWI